MRKWNNEIFTPFLKSEKSSNGFFRVEAYFDDALKRGEGSACCDGDFDTIKASIGKDLLSKPSTCQK
jgi:hypothetical protein